MNARLVYRTRKATRRRPAVQPSLLGAAPALTLAADEHVPTTIAKRQAINHAARHSVTLYAYADPRRGFSAVTDAAGRTLYAGRCRTSAPVVDPFEAALCAAEDAIRVAAAIAAAHHLAALRLYLRTPNPTGLFHASHIGLPGDRAGYGKSVRRVGLLAIQSGIVLHVEDAPNSACPAFLPARAGEAHAIRTRDLPAPRPLQSMPAQAPMPPVQDATPAEVDTTPVAFGWSDLQFLDAAAVRKAILDLAHASNCFRPAVIQPELARAILHHTNFHGQRPVNETRLEERQQAIERNQWFPGASVIHFDQTPDGKLHLVDGQHRMLAGARAGLAFATHLSVANAADLNEVRRHYALYDLPTAVRSNAEVAAGYGKVTKGKRADTTLRLKMLNALGVLHAEILGDGRKGRGVLFAELPVWRDAADALQRALHLGPNSIRGKLIASRPLATLLYLLHYMPASAEAFIHGIAHADELDARDVRARAASLLTSTRLSSRATARCIVDAWNLYRGQRLPRAAKVDTWPVPMHGTPSWPKVEAV